MEAALLTLGLLVEKWMEVISEGNRVNKDQKQNKHVLFNAKQRTRLIDHAA